MNICIDNKTGLVNLDGFKINPSTKTNELPAYFELGNEEETKFLNKTVHFLFATTSFSEGSLLIKMELRFEQQVLVSIFIKVTDENIKYKNDNEWYGSSGEREKLHIKWLKNHMNWDQELSTIYKWGVIGIGKDKSESVFIYLHNINNTWVLD